MPVAGLEVDSEGDFLRYASFPSDTLSTHYIHQAGAARPKQWWLLDARPVGMRRSQVWHQDLVKSGNVLSPELATHKPRNRITMRLPDFSGGGGI